MKGEIGDTDCGEAVRGAEELKCSWLSWQEDAE